MLATDGAASLLVATAGPLGLGHYAEGSVIGGVGLCGELAVHGADELSEIVKDGAEFFVFAGLGFKETYVGVGGGGIGDDLNLGLMAAGALDLVAEVGEK